MKSFVPLTVSIFILLFLTITSFAQNCDCDSVISARTSQVMKRVKNSNSFKLISFRKKAVIKSIAEKEKILQLMNVDSAWLPLYDHGDSITVLFGRRDTLWHHKIYLFDGAIIDSVKAASLTHEENFRLVITSFSNAVDTLHPYVSKIRVLDEYYEVYFSINGHIVMSPTVCRKSLCDTEDNIILPIFWSINIHR